MLRIRSTLATVAVVVAAALGGGAIASAATSSSSSSTSSPAIGQAQAFNPSQGGHTFGGKTEVLLTGDVASKVRAAALAKVSGTVERVETNVDDSVPYEAHVLKSDGAEVIVEVNGDYTVANVLTRGAGH
jgi:hypothetical protein